MARLVVINRVSKAVHFPRAAVSVVLKAAERAWQLAWLLRALTRAK